VVSDQKVLNLLIIKNSSQIKYGAIRHQVSNTKEPIVSNSKRHLCDFV